MDFLSPSNQYKCRPFKCASMFQTCDQDFTRSRLLILLKAVCVIFIECSLGFFVCEEKLNHLRDQR